VLELVVEGMTNEEISDVLDISVGRARNIVTEMISKCMVKNRTQLAVMAVKKIRRRRSLSVQAV
jgi:DNA-binding NarL/FixJ family response regulator